MRQGHAHKGAEGRHEEEALTRAAYVRALHANMG
jgi:hypothetical protein